MSKLMSQQRAIQRLAERVSDRTKNDRRNQLQRRNEVVDIYGQEFVSQGDSATPASFFVSVTPDLVYYERFEFKLVIRPFDMPVGGSGSTGYTTVQVNDTTVVLNGTTITINGTSLAVTENAGVYTITPNPHTHTSPSHTHTAQAHNHTTVAHNHNLDAGVTKFPSTLSDLRVVIDGVDITDYLKLQYPQWITGEGFYPSAELENFDLLEVAGLLPDWQQGILLAPGYKNVQLIGNGTFNCALILYLKLSHTNR